MDDGFADDQERILKDIDARLAGLEKDRKLLIPILQTIQQAHQYLPAPALILVAEHLGISTSEVYGVATFYNQFRFNPPGRHPIKVCMGTACHVKGGEIILENFQRKLEISEGETTPDREFSIERVACVGCCALAPVTLVDETVQGHMTPSKVEGLVMRIGIENEMKERERLDNEP